MTVDIDLLLSGEPIRCIPLLPVSVDTLLFEGDGQLCGWSLRDASAETPLEASGSVTSPAALATIATTTSLPAGTYNITWTVELAGTLAAADANNFRLVDANGNVLVSINAAVAGVYPQAPVEVTTTIAGAVFVQAIALGTVGAIYSAQISVVPASQIGTIVEVRDGNNVLGCSDMTVLGSDTQLLFDAGLHIRNQLLVHVIQGVVTGAVYARFAKNTGSP